MLIKLPKNQQSGTNVDSLVGLKDILPTVLGILQIDAPAQVTGKNLLGPGGDFSEQGSAYLMGESSHCKKERSLECSPLGPEGKVFALRTPQTSMWLSPQADKNLIWSFKDSEESSAELFDAQEASSKEQDYLERLLSERRTRMDSLTAIQWPQKKTNSKTTNNKSSNSITEEEEMELLKQLGYVDDE